MQILFVWIIGLTALDIYVHCLAEQNINISVNVCWPQLEKVFITLLPSALLEEFIAICDH